MMPAKQNMSSHEEEVDLTTSLKDKFKIRFVDLYFHY